MNLHIARNSPAATSTEPSGPGSDRLATAGAVTRQETTGTAVRYPTVSRDRRTPTTTTLFLSWSRGLMFNLIQKGQAFFE